MADEPTPKQQKAPSKPLPERPVAEREPLTIVVIEQDTPVRVRRPVRIPGYGEVPRVPRWYWVFAALAAAVLYLTYKAEWAGPIFYALHHRLVPARVVRIEHSLVRHTLGERAYKALKAPAHSQRQS